MLSEKLLEIAGKFFADLTFWKLNSKKDQGSKGNPGQSDEVVDLLMELMTSLINFEAAYKAMERYLPRIQSGQMSISKGAASPKSWISEHRRRISKPLADTSI